MGLRTAVSNIKRCRKPWSELVVQCLYKHGWGCRVTRRKNSLRDESPLLVSSRVYLLPPGHILMDRTTCTVTQEEFKLFHRIDIALYIILVRDLCRDPSECMNIMGLWLWLEHGGFCNVINKILYLPPFLINELADEAVSCLLCMKNQFSFSSKMAEIPLTHSLAKKDISMLFFHENRILASLEIQNLVSKICIPAFSDIYERARCPGRAKSNQIRSASSPENFLMQYFSRLNIRGYAASPSRGRSRAIETSKYERTMFMTFSKGYPVTENEVRQYFTGVYGNCIESFHMQEVRPDEQALYARIVFLRPSFINMILKGVNKAKLTINGKHVWMRKFVPRTVRPSP